MIPMIACEVDESWWETDHTDLTNKFKQILKELDL
jgi:hypothetical protein